MKEIFKRKLCILTALVVFMTMWMPVSAAEDIVVEYKDMVLSFGYVAGTTSGYISDCPENIEGVVVVPAKVKKGATTYTVETIAKHAFSDVDKMTELRLPSTVKTIDEWSITYCEALRSINLENVTSIGSYAFKQCYNLSCTVPDDAEVSAGAFDWVANVNYNGTDERAPWGARTLNGYVEGDFVYADSSKRVLTACATSVTGTVVIPDGVEVIGEYAFVRCSSMEEVIIPDSVTTIEFRAFEGCYSLGTVVIPDSVTSIGAYAFDDVTHIVHNYYIKNQTWGAKCANGYVEGNLIYKDSSKEELVGCLPKQTGDVVIPDTVTDIGEKAFKNCWYITSITIPDSVENVETYAMAGCYSLKKVVFLDGNNKNSKVFGQCVFAWDCSLEEVVLPDTLIKIGYSDFLCCESLKSIEIPDTVISIDGNAFCSCDNLETITLPDSLEAIGSDAFLNCNSLKSIELPESLQIIEGGAFRYCSSLKSVVIPENVESFGKEEGSGNADGVFAGCSGLKSVVFECDIDNIPAKTFYGCSSLMSVKLPGGIKTIDENAFYKCGNLMNIVVPAGVETVADGAFNGAERVFYAGKLDTSLWGAKRVVAGAGLTTVDSLNISEKNRSQVKAGCTSEAVFDGNIQYRWVAYRKNSEETVVIQDWKTGASSINWTPDCFGEYVITAQTRLEEYPEFVTSEETDAFEYNPHIKGKCQMPYNGEGGGFLIGVESYENPKQAYQYEMLILDCTLLAEGKPAWVYTTGKYKVSEGNAAWCIWQPEYGYYWTLFRVYDAKGNMIDQACYPFENIY